ncbi:hypothetical protein, partial [Nocardioides malaquae]|uniref:hypothetical protein n=1 Tax=Nocardioides malaquae TaxID=2773426 RepID=UPI001D0D3296
PWYFTECTMNREYMKVSFYFILYFTEENLLLHNIQLFWHGSVYGQGELSRDQLLSTDPL